MKRALVAFSLFLAFAANAEPPSIYSQDGKYLGKLGGSEFDPDSTNNPYGRYGSEYSADSINNPYGRYGSEYSNESPNNPYATRQPVIIGDD